MVFRTCGGRGAWAMLLAAGSLVWFLAGAETAQGDPFDIGLYQQFLDRYVVSDQQIGEYTLAVVDYRKIWERRDNPDSLYRKVLSRLETLDPELIGGRLEKIAFWINVYNVGAIKMIIDHYPVDSIRSTRISWVRNPWGRKVITVGGREYSLGEIEHDILLGSLREPLAHFGIVCASLSCPDISGRAYQGAMVMDQLGEQARRFLRDRAKGLNIDREQRKIFFSRIFKFDKKSFPGGAEGAIPWIGPYLEPGDRDYLNTKAYGIAYLDYDWSLNDRKRVR